MSKDENETVRITKGLTKTKGIIAIIIAVVIYLLQVEAFNVGTDEIKLIFNKLIIFGINNEAEAAVIIMMLCFTAAVIYISCRK